MSHKNLFIKIPENYKTEFAYQACKENIFRLMIVAGGLSVVELFVALFYEDYLSYSFYLSLGLSILCIIFFPILLYFNKNINRLPIGWMTAIQTIFILILLFGGVMWSILDQGAFASGNTFILCIFVLSALISIPPGEGIALFLFAYLCFYFLLPLSPYNSDNAEVIGTLRINGFCMSLLAGIINRIVFKNQLQSFLQKKVIEEKNKELEQKNRELTEMTMKDSMTSLLNHKSSFKRLKEEVERAKRIQYPLSVAMVDLDNFKLINDSHGHQTGDEVLIQVAAILKNSCRATDVIGRYGGEEFIVIMPDTNMQDAALLMKRIQENVKEAKFEKGVQVTLSCGISELKSETAHGLIRSSDLMLYRAKKKGKDRVEINSISDKKSAAIK